MGLSLLVYTVAALVVGYAVGLFWIYIRQSGRLYRPLAEIMTRPDEHGYSYEDVTFASADGVKLNGWFVHHPQPRGVLMFFHGNTRNISHCLDSIALFHRLGFSTFLFDYRGYGRSEGQPGEQGTYFDAQGARDYLLQERNIRPDEIVMLGRSLGAAIAVWLAARHAPRALVIESTFTSFPAAAADHYPWLPTGLLARYRYAVDECLRKVYCPVLVVHSPDDEIIPCHHGRKLFEIAHEPKAFLEISGRHYNGYRISGVEYERGLAEFFDRHSGSA